MTATPKKAPESKAPAKKAESKPEPKVAAKKADTPKPKAAEKKDSKTTVQVTLSDVHSDVLDNLRGASSRHDYVQALVNAHLEAANPVGSFGVDDDLPGNEREVKHPVFRI